MISQYQLTDISNTIINCVSDPSVCSVRLIGVEKFYL